MRLSGHQHQGGRRSGLYSLCNNALTALSAAGSHVKVDEVVEAVSAHAHVRHQARWVFTHDFLAISTWLTIQHGAEPGKPDGAEVV